MRRLIDEYPKRRKELSAHAARPRGYYDPDVQLAFERSRRAGLAARRKQLERSITAIRREMKTDAQGRSARYRQLIMKRDVIRIYPYPPGDTEETSAAYAVTADGRISRSSSGWRASRQSPNPSRPVTGSYSTHSRNGLEPPVPGG